MIDRLFRERLDALSDPLDPGFGFDLIRLAAGRTEIVVQQQRDLDATVGALAALDVVHEVASVLRVEGN